MEDKIIAPDLSEATDWINSGQINIQRAKHRLKLINFWNYSCPKSDKSLQKAQELYYKYINNGLMVVGIHIPQFEHEKDIDIIRNHINEEGIDFPIGIDNDMMVWNKYGQRHYPAFVLIDPDGMVISRHIGEGGYYKLEKEIIHSLKKYNIN